MHLLVHILVRNTMTLDPESTTDDPIDGTRNLKKTRESFKRKLERRWKNIERTRTRFWGRSWREMVEREDDNMGSDIEV